jgi:L-fuculose-phosphate aldolase
MLKENFHNQIKSISLSMFRKDFIGIYHGSFSVKTNDSHFIINKRTAIFDHIEPSDLVELNFKEDYRWKEASIDSKIHRSIYENITNAKYIAYTRPVFTMAYAMNHTKIIPQDYFGLTRFKSIPVFEPKQFDDWYERGEFEIYKHLKQEKSPITIVRGYGVYTYARDIQELAQMIDILENSCKLLVITNLAHDPNDTQCELPNYQI